MKTVFLFGVWINQSKRCRRTRGGIFRQEGLTAVNGKEVFSDGNTETNKLLMGGTPGGCLIWVACVCMYFMCVVRGKSLKCRRDRSVGESGGGSGGH